jgi:hypothetical protein
MLLVKCDREAVEEREIAYRKGGGKSSNVYASKVGSQENERDSGGLYERTGENRA